MKQKVAVLGAGSWGTALSMVLDENGHDVRLWGNDPKQIKEINERHTNEHYLPGAKLSEAIVAYTDLKAAINEADALLFVLPTKAIRVVAKEVATLLDGQTKPHLIHASKGLEQDTHKRISVIIQEEIPAEKYDSLVVLSGPSHAEEVAKKDITTITAASESEEDAGYVQKLFMNPYFRVYRNTDVIGVELGAALKNIIAVGAGALHGLGYGDNAKAALMTRGLAEISRLGTAFGADPMTFFGLSGVGDLIVTGTSRHSRNWRAGDLIGKGQDLDEVLKNMGMVVEGVATTKAAYELAKEKGIEMPITEAIYKVLYEKVDVKKAIEELMLREGKAEQSSQNVEKGSQSI
ncbi:NAD(P)H-dependent glycerol-3-phosphate dehydrogenase [Trichococcus collinsii]|uniref:Glycerol-3-phosphate dehydrogenase [NAD(P)+] n=1 Tax=Trichococcus collinsii TaxID=157076 RepID=A0AB37ZZX2_9LACT|nr:NAD(P)H-dependent glycerol-3-phosphate dehydrogenase [Trichococcus collinsii]CZQ88006.1 glycerol-3-phosphate dehydrogenase nad-dependent [Trichococcus collinsii]SEA44011.1 glycerol-3-phosphate dehydrogenase (NAD(P)+) [Trichococcus collinsii]